MLYLGFVASKEALKMDLEKLKSIVDWSVTSCTYDVRSFHGLASLYWKFIKTLVGSTHHLPTVSRKELSNGQQRQQILLKP